MILLTKLFAVSLLALWREANSLTCPLNYRPNGPTRCLFIVNNQTATAASASCGSNQLADVQDSQQYTNLKLYLQVQGTPSALYWTRYSFNAQGTLTPSSAIVNNSANFNGNSSGTNGQCVAIQQQGLFVVMTCSTNLPFICVSDTSGTTTPTASLSSMPNSPVVGANVTLTCSYSNSTSISFQKDDVAFYTSSVPLSTTTSQSTITLSNIQAGRYDCVATNPLGAVKSTAIIITATSAAATTIAPITLMLNGGSANIPVTLPLGSTFTITCSTSSSVSWSWFRNGIPLTSSSNDTLVVSDFNTYDSSGFYQCRALDTTSNSNAMQQVLVLATDGVPDPLDTVLASTSSQTGLLVSWVPPSNPNTDQSLLRYTVSWCNNISPLCNTSSGVAPMSNPNPALGITFPFTGQMNISQLQPGTQYVVQVGVTSPAGGVVAPLYNATVETFGTVPTSTVQIWNVSRTQDNTTIVAYWQPLVTTPPVGRVGRYYVEYRDASKGTSNTVFVSSVYNYIVIQNLLDANNYEVRVRAAVQVSSNPNAFGQTAPSNWTFSSGVAPFVPSIPPTDVVQTSVDSSVIVPAVIVPVFVVIVCPVTIAVVILLVYKKSKPVEAVDAGYDIGLMPAEQEPDKKPMLSVDS